MSEDPRPHTEAPAQEPPTEGAMTTPSTYWHLPPPRTVAEAMALAKIIAESGFCPREYKGRPYDILVAIQFGSEVGLKPLQALQSIVVINGRPTIWGDGALGLVRASGLLEKFKEDDVTVIKRNGFARCVVKRQGMEDQIERTFSIDDAKQAGLWTKDGPWRTYPLRMLQMRARSWALRDGFSDVLKGLQIREEVLDFEPHTEEPSPTPDAEPSSPSGQTQTEKLKEKLKAQAAPPPPEEEQAPPPPPLEPEGRKISGQVRGITAPAGTKPGTIKIGTDEALITAWFRDPPAVLAALPSDQWWSINGRQCTAWVAERLNQRKQTFVILTSLELDPEDDIPEFNDPMVEEERAAIQAESGK